MQAELESRDTLRPIQILGVNAVDLESGSDTITADRSLPWLQPVAGDDPWTFWPIAYRDVVIVGPGNERLGNFNLTSHNLAEPGNYAALRDQLLNAANE